MEPLGRCRRSRRGDCSLAPSHLRQNPKIRSMAQYYSDGMKHTSLAFFRDAGMSSVEASVIKYLDECRELYREGI